MVSISLANAILVSTLVVAAFTSILAVSKLVPETNVSKSDSVTGEVPAVGDEIFARTPLGPVYSSSPYILPISWGAVAGALIWRGRIRSVWTRQGYDYETFRLVARMKGSHLRVRLLSTASLPKNRMQLAEELDVDWKTIDNHVEVLLKNKLIDEIAQVGNSKYYIISEHGKRILSLILSSNGNNSDDSNCNINNNSSQND